MSCPFDLHDYHFGDLALSEQGKIEEHLRACEPCAAELERLRLTTVALRALPQEEIPRRIAFVSDKVFDPSPVSRWWQAFWMSGARMASAAVALLAVAILIHAFRPQPSTPTSVRPAPVAEVRYDPAALQTAVNQAVARAVADSDARYDAKLKLVMAENQQQKRVIERASELIDSMDRRERVMTVASNRPPMEGQ